MTIRNLVFECGGMKCIAYAGALQALHDRGLLGSIRGVAGSSAGALMAMLLALRYTPQQIRRALLDTDFSTFHGRLEPLHIASRYGLSRGDGFYQWIVERLLQAGYTEDLRFSQLADSALLDLRVYATDLTEKTVREFSAAATPDVPVGQAVRASMTIPLMFDAWQFPGGVPDDHYYVDGGVVLGYPIHAFDADSPPADTLGFHLNHHNDAGKNENISNVFGFIGHLFESLMQSQRINLNQSPAVLERTVIIDDFGIAATDFSLNHEQLKTLFDSGYESARGYLDRLSASLERR